MEAGEAAEGREAGGAGLWVLEREIFAPLLSRPFFFFFFFNVPGWGVAESWRKSCLCVALALSLARSFSFAIHFLPVWPSRSHFGEALAITPFGERIWGVIYVTFRVCETYTEP